MAADRVPPAVDVTPGTTMRLDAIAIGHNPPEDVNVIIEVPIGGEPIKYEMDKAAGTLVVDRFLHTPTLSRQLRLRAAHAVGRR
jgi:inorganic pyrophosphatase